MKTMEKIQKIDEENFKKAIKNDGLIIVDFSAPWCPDCVRINPILEILAETYEQKVSFYQINIDEEEELKNALNIRRIPTILFYENGVEVGERLVEPASRHEIEDAIKKILSR